MAKKASKTELAVVGTGLSIGDLINKIPEELKLQKERLKELIGDNDDNTLSLDTTYEGKALKNFTTLAELVALHAALNARSAAFITSSIALGLDGKIQDWEQDGHSIEKWNALIVKASKSLLNKAEIESIKERIESLEHFLPEEHKLMATLGNLLENSNRKLK